MKESSSEKKLKLDELRKQYGLGDEEMSITRGSCTLTLKCAYHTLSCTSTKGDCKTMTEVLGFNPSLTPEEKVVVAIVCDGKEYKCTD